MIIYCENSDFKPEKFQIIRFYDSVTCFAWAGRQIVAFPYKYQTSTPKLTVLNAPRDIKSVYSYSGRVFILCKPSGVWKITKKYEFALLSMVAVGMSSYFLETFTVSENYLNHVNKTTKVLTPLFMVSDVEHTSNFLSMLPLDAQSVDRKLKKALSMTHASFSIIAFEKKVFKVCDNVAHLIYTSLWDIYDILSVKKGDTIVAVLLKTKSDAVIVGYPSDNKLSFVAIHLNAEIKHLAGFVGTSDENLMVVHTNGQKVTCVKQNLKLEISEVVGVKLESIIFLQFHDKVLLGLSNNGQLVELDFNTTQRLSHEPQDFYNLKEDMLKGSDVIVDKIFERSQELKTLNETLLVERDKLKRINIYAHKQKISCLPKFQVDRMGGFVFLKAIFNDLLPQNTMIFLNLACAGRTAFSSKMITGLETVVELPLNPELLNSTLDITVDLVTFIEEDKPWCIVQNCINDTSAKKDDQIHKLLNEKKSFLHSKLNALKNLVNEETIDMSKLSNIKKSIRREIPDV